jgi:hypothetical protein
MRNLIQCIDYGVYGVAPEDCPLCPCCDQPMWVGEGITLQTVAQWHDKNARLCLEVSKDDPRLNADDRRRAFEAHRHHAASAAAIRNKLSDERRAAIRALTDGGGSE